MSNQPATAAHRPERYYGECRGCTRPDDLPENLPESLEALAAEYESDYYDAHFTVGDDDLVACEPSFDGYGCPACADDANDYFRPWTDCPWYDPDAPLPDSHHEDPPTVPDALREAVDA